MNDVKLKCNCGQVRGVAYNVTPRSGNRIVCHCDDCQSFARYLGIDGILDENNGTDIFQMSYADVEITEGSDRLRSIKLTPKGMIRWFTDCCRTPVGNTISDKMPFIGLVHTFIEDTSEQDKNMGSVIAHANIKKNSPASQLSTPMYKVVPRVVSKLVVWKIRDSRKKNPFFDKDSVPISEPEILTK